MKLALGWSSPLFGDEFDLSQHFPCTDMIISVSVHATHARANTAMLTGVDYNAMQPATSLKLLLM
jgi:hypothetical protein